VCSSDLAVFLEHAHDLRDLGLLLADRDVDALHAAVALIDDRVDTDRRLARLAVAKDQLTLPPTDGGHGVDGLDAGLERRIDVLPLDDAGRDALDVAAAIRLDRALAVDRLAERVHHAAQQGVAHGDGSDRTGGADLVALFDVGVVTHDDDRHGVFLEVEDESAAPGLGELHQLT